VQYAYESEKVPYILARHYIPDFVVQTPTGKVYIECKGYLRPEHKAKMVAVKKIHPEMDIRILFYALKKQYVKWAERAGFKWAVGKIPREWLDGF
jgi:predicted nuclease of restriction endonuclease-like RecB superfamily